MYARTIQCSTGGIITACHAELTGAGRQPSGCEETEGNVELYNKDTGNSSAGMRSVPEGKDRL